MADINELIDEIEDIMDNASSVPFSRKVSVDPDEIFEIVRDMRDSLPTEIKNAQWINEEKDRILNCIAYHRTKDLAEDEFFNIFYRSDKLSRPCFRCPAYEACNWSYEKKNHEIKY